MQIGMHPGGITRIVILSDAMRRRPSHRWHRATMARSGGVKPAGSLALCRNSSTVIAQPLHFLENSGWFFSEDSADDVLDRQLRHRQIRHGSPVEDKIRQTSATRRPGNPDPHRIRSFFQDRAQRAKVRIGRSRKILHRRSCCRRTARRCRSSRSVEHDAPVVNEDDALAKLFDVLHVVAGQQDRGAALSRCGA